MSQREIPQSVRDEQRVVEVQERWHLLTTRSAAMAGLLTELNPTSERDAYMTVFRLVIEMDTERRALVNELEVLLGRIRIGDPDAAA